MRVRVCESVSVWMYECANTCLFNSIHACLCLGAPKIKSNELFNNAETDRNIRLSNTEQLAASLKVCNSNWGKLKGNQMNYCDWGMRRTMCNLATGNYVTNKTHKKALPNTFGHQQTAHTTKWFTDQSDKRPRQAITFTVKLCCRPSLGRCLHLTIEYFASTGPHDRRPHVNRFAAGWRVWWVGGLAGWQAGRLAMWLSDSFKEPSSSCCHFDET